jgi:hypothetical protein
MAGRQSSPVKMLHQGAADADVRDGFWNQPDGPYRQTVKDAFAGYEDWWQTTSDDPTNRGTFPVLRGRYTRDCDRHTFLAPLARKGASHEVQPRILASPAQRPAWFPQSGIFPLQPLAARNA